MTAPLFRQEIAVAVHNAWLGEAQIAQPLPIRAVAAACVGLVAAALCFAFLGTYTRRVHADGVLAPNIGLVTIASPVAGRVSIAGVQEGDKVERGQLLYTLDLDAVSTSGPTQERIIAQLDRQRTSIETQRALRASLAATEKRALQDQLRNLEAQLSQLVVQIDVQAKLVVPLKAHAEQLSDLVTRGYARSADLQSQNYLYMQASAQLSQFTQERLQLTGKIDGLISQLVSFDSKLARDLAEMDRSAAQLEQQKVESEARRSIEVRAPESGLLTSIRAQAGQQVAAGTSLLTLLPSKGRLQANLYVDSSAIGFIEAGATVMLRYAAFPFQRFGLHRGVVTEVTRAPLQSSDVLDTVSRQRAPGGVYRIVVKPDSEDVDAYGTRRPLTAGMRVEADIALERRPLYRWLLDPVAHVERSVGLVTGGGLR